MTVISAWWGSNMPFQRRLKWHIPMATHGEILSGRLNYYITRWRQEVWRSESLETWCSSRESQHPAESWAPWLPVEWPWRTIKTQSWWPQEWGSICCSFVRSLTPSHTQPFQIKWEVYFSKRLCCSSLLCRCYDSACMYADVYVLCGYATVSDKRKIHYQN